MKKLIFALAIASVFTACNNNADEKKEITKDSIGVANAVPSLKQNPDETPGIIGVFDIPEILTLAILDSAKQEDIGFKIGKAYSAIEADINTLGLSAEGLPPGAIYYNNNPENFVFECIVPINRTPKEQPKNSTIVVLEATRAVVYNYYGPYDKMFNAYAELKTYLEKNKLEQSGAAREFYISDATVEKDPNKWLSKIYIPVK